MSVYIVRNRGFFYTDEYYAPENVFRRVDRGVYKTRAEADKACATLVRAWLRAEPISDWLFDEGDRIGDVLEYMNAQWPDEDFEWDRDLAIPDDATDAQVDEIAKRIGVAFAQVFEVDDPDELDDDSGGMASECNFGPDADYE